MIRVISGSLKGRKLKNTNTDVLRPTQAKVRKSIMDSIRIFDNKKVLDLFSGIGGFSLGLEWAGMETIAMCEKDAFCRQILAKHWPDIPIHEDIRSLDGSQYKSVDVICGGFPCQPYSQAGRQLGNKDDRDLWSEMFRIIQESCPTWVIGENVSGFIGMALDDV